MSAEVTAERSYERKNIVVIRSSCKRVPSQFRKVGIPRMSRRSCLAPPQTPDNRRKTASTADDLTSFRNAEDDTEDGRSHTRWIRKTTACDHPRPELSPQFPAEIPASACPSTGRLLI